MLPVMHDLIEQLLVELPSHPKRAYMRGKSNMNIEDYQEGPYRSSAQREKVAPHFRREYFMKV
jgi:hypothetical protein